MSVTIDNPILKGFHPDPSIIRVGQDYYLATSTFEWFPGVRIYHSRNLAHWRLAATPLHRLSQLDMRGNPDSCGVWAPCLSYHQGTFYLVYTNTRRYHSHYKDTPNYLVTATAIEGEWSEPIYLNSSGFDPSLFHDSDGKKWLLNMVWDHRQRGPRQDWSAENYFGGIALREYDPKARRLVGPGSIVFPGSALGKTEGPHLYQRNGYYYLLVAEGGTGVEHACTMARARELHGPYKVDPAGPLLSSHGAPQHALQRAGHGDLVDTPDGESYLVHLCSRPLPDGRSVMGRETAIQRISWINGWPRLSHGGTLPAPHVGADGGDAISHVAPPVRQHEDFNSTTLSSDFQTLRRPLSPELLSLQERPGYLRLRGAESLGSPFNQALVARRQQAFHYEASTAVEFQPENFQQMAGLVCYYNSSKYHYLCISCDDDNNRVLDVVSCKGQQTGEYALDESIGLPATGPIYLKATVRQQDLQFSFATAADQWQDIPVIFDYSLLADEVGEGGEHANFTGAFVGLCCQDLSGMRIPADFDFFSYVEF